MQRESPILIATSEEPFQALPRKPWTASFRETVSSFGMSFVIHALLFLIPISWLLSATPNANEPSLLLTNLDTEQDALETFLDAPREVPPLETDPIPREVRFVSSADDEPDLKGISLPPLRNRKSEDPAPAPQNVPPAAETIEEQLEIFDEKLELEIQERLNREGGQSGAIQVSLMWNNGNDVDLYVQTPVGDIIAFNYKTSRCGGELDVDMNAKKVQSLKPVENVFWSDKQAPLGVFVVGVHEYQNHGYRDPTPYLVSVKVAGEVHHFRGRIRRGSPIQGVCKFRRTAAGVTFLETPATLAGNKSGKPVFK